MLVIGVLKERINLSDTESGTFIDPERLSEGSLRRRNPLNKLRKSAGKLVLLVRKACTATTFSFS